MGGSSKPTNLLMNFLLLEKKVANEIALPTKNKALNNFKEDSLRRALFSNNFTPEDASKAMMGTS